MLGYTPKEIVQLHCWDWDDVFPTREAFLARWPELPTTSGSIESRHRRKDGSVFDVEVVWNPAQWGDERHLFCVCRDITERKQAEAERRNLEKHLLHGQKLESIGRLAGGVAHDFNNMLQSILGFTDLALEEADPDSDMHDYLTEIEKAAQRSADLTRQLLAFARKQTASPVSLDLNAAVPDTIKLLRRLIGEGIKINWSPGNGLANVRIDPTQLDQILTNLTLNARDALEGEGRIDIETCSAVIDEDYCMRNAEAVPGDYTVLVVSDNGRGMDKHTAAHIFEPFYTTKQPGEGTGLGLATVYGIVKQNAGFINVYSEPGMGTTFRIHLPATTEVLAERAAPARGTPVRGSETILLVEDEPMILSLGQRLLEGLGYKVLIAGDPAEALLLASNNTGKIDLLMTDVVMPGLNGRQLAQQITEMQPGVKCLYMSGYTANVIAHHGVLDEGVHFIQKPFTVQELGRKVRDVLGS
ncbi:MAG: two-component system, cell cycle sensor histidine kinase and response regulator CckA [Candidatus Sumerlaeota bacterium]|nr:two-component system, cell cycle sensor histidine kinase and response regulator CckA [Candidatus Sumerlaeota bacterium]